MHRVEPTTVGVGYRHALADWIRERPLGLQCLEITAEHFFGGNEAVLRELRDNYQLFVHGLGLSLGTPGPLRADVLRRFVHVAEVAQATWVSEHIAFTRTGDLDLGHLNPVPPTRTMAALIAEHAREVADVCGRPMILENITSHVALPGDLEEPEFLNEICRQANCGLLIDVTNLFINSRNHRFDPLAWLRQVDPASIVQLHLVGYSQNKDGRYADDHAAPMQEDLLELARDVVDYSTGLRAIILERDAHIPGSAEMARELGRLHGLLRPLT